MATRGAPRLTAGDKRGWPLREHSSKDVFSILLSSEMDRKVWGTEGRTCSKGRPAGIETRDQDRSLMVRAPPGEPPGGAAICEAVLILSSRSVSPCRSVWLQPVESLF